MIENFERVTTVHPAYMNDFVIRASHRFVATALWGAPEEVRTGFLKHLPPLTRSYLEHEIEAYEGRPTDGVEDTQRRMLELLVERDDSEFYQESTISVQDYGPTVRLSGSEFQDVITYVLELASKIHAQGIASIAPDIPNCPIPFLRLALELLLLNLPWEEIGGILWGHVRSYRMRHGRFDGSGRWWPADDEAEGKDRMLNFCIVTCSALQLQAHPVLVSRSIRAFTGGDYTRLRQQRDAGTETVV